MLSIIREALTPVLEVHSEAIDLKKPRVPIAQCGTTICAPQQVPVESARLLVLDNEPKTKVKVSVRKYTAAGSFYQKR